MRNVLKVGLLSALVLVALTAVASAASGWTANPGTTYADGVVTLDSSTHGPTSYENADLAVPVENGDQITFEWRSSDVACAGGVPRIFIQGGAYNTWDADPAGALACGTDSNGDGWNEVSTTIAGISGGTAGYTGIVNDQTSDPGTIQVRNVVIAGVEVLPLSSKGECKNGGWARDGYKNQGACVSSFVSAG